MLVAKHFQHKTEIFFKEIKLDGSLAKTKYCAISIGFQEQVSHMSIVMDVQCTQYSK